MADKLTRDKEKKDKSSHKSEIKSASDTSHSQKRPIIKAEEDLTEKASTLSPPPSPNATPVEPEPTVFRYQIYKENIFIDQLISAAADGDYEIVNHLINQKNIDVNSKSNGLTALSACAASSQNINIIKLLLDKGAHINDAHLFAIAKGHAYLTEKLIISLIASNPSNPLIEFEPVKDSNRFSSDLTPMMVACIFGHLKILRALQFRGHTLDKPHPNDCTCSTCNQEEDTPLSQSIRRFNLYRANTNPAYIHLTEENPIPACLEYSKELLGAKEQTNCFSIHYRTLVAIMENYSIELLRFCRNGREVTALLESTTTSSNKQITYPVIQDAISEHWYDFLSTPQIQYFRRNVWMLKDKSAGKWWSSFAEANWFSKLFYCILVVILQPITFGLKTIINVEVQKNMAPHMRYLGRIAYETIFTGILFHCAQICSDQGKAIQISSNKEVLRVNKPEIYLNYYRTIGCWSIGYLVEMIKKIHVLGFGFFLSYYGNLFDILITFQLITLMLIEDNLIIDLGRFEIRRNIFMVVGLTIYFKLVFISMLRAYLGTPKYIAFGFLKIFFMIVTIFITTFPVYIVLAEMLPRLIRKTDHNNLLILLCLSLNLLFGLIFEAAFSADILADSKTWNYAWTTYVFNDYHGSTVFPVPLNLLETAPVLWQIIKKNIIKKIDDEIVDLKRIKIIKHIKTRWELKTWNHLSSR